jgi:hypothetical protein
MSLILAIEPDRRQAAHLISIVRHVQGAELVLADTTERALESIGNSVPDLILVPALLSPQDDAALAAALRVIATAAHVQMLTIPTLATPKPRARKGVLSFLRKSASDGPLDGCDPKVFAEEIASYLERANEERSASPLYGDDQDSPEPEPQPAPSPAPAFDESLASFESADVPVSYADDWTHAPSAAAPEYYAAPADGVSAERVIEADPFADASATEERPAVVEIAYSEAARAAIVEEAVVEVPMQVESWAMSEAPPIVELAPHAMPALDELVTALEQSEPGLEPGEPWIVPIVDERYEEPIQAQRQAPAPSQREPLPIKEPKAPEIPTAAEPHVPAMAFDEFVATLKDAKPVVIEDALPVTAASEPPRRFEPVETSKSPDFEDLLADFERANLPVIEEVRAEQWMADTPGPVDEAEEDRGEASDEDELVDIDLSIELDAVFLAEEPGQLPEPLQALKPFEPVVPVERFEPFPLAAWQAWPRLDWTPPDKPADIRVSEVGAHDTHDSNPSLVAEFEQTAEFEAALQAGEPELKPFEPIVPIERFEPMPLATWLAWPRLEGVVAEAYTEPIAPRKAVAKPEWVELMRSLREDIARRRAELAASGPIAPPAQKPRRPLAATTRVRAAKPAAPAVADAETKRPKRTRPIEDEWGLFDPEQCGFAALLDKLDEITVTPPSPQPRRPPR